MNVKSGKKSFPVQQYFVLLFIFVPFTIYYCDFICRLLTMPRVAAMRLCSELKNCREGETEWK